ncbi:MAG: hypothetical protein ACK5V3_11735 [Bdellovibrionales bacterium]
MKTIILAILITAGQLHANQKLTCTDLLEKKARAEGKSLNELYAIQGGLIVGFAIMMSFTGAGTVADMGVDNAALSSTIGLAAGGLVGKAIWDKLQTNPSDINNLDHEIKAGGGSTLQVLARAIMLQLDESVIKKYSTEKELFLKIENEIKLVVTHNPQICANTNTNEIFKQISDIVSQRL